MALQYKLRVEAKGKDPEIRDCDATTPREASMASRELQAKVREHKGWKKAVVVPFQVGGR